MKQGCNRCSLVVAPLPTTNHSTTREQESMVPFTQQDFWVKMQESCCIIYYILLYYILYMFTWECLKNGMRLKQCKYRAPEWNRPDTQWHTLSRRCKMEHFQCVAATHPTVACYLCIHSVSCGKFHPTTHFWNKVPRTCHRFQRI